MAQDPNPVPHRGDLLLQVGTGRWWAFTDPYWVAVEPADAVLLRITVLLEAWRESGDEVRAACAAEIERHAGSLKRWSLAQHEQEGEPGGAGTAGP